MNMVMNMNMVTIISFWYSIADMKQAEKLISCKMKGGWMKNADWKKNDEGWWFQAVKGFDDEWTSFVNVELLLQLKIF